MEVQFKQWLCVIDPFGTNENKHFDLIEKSTGETVITATKNLPNAKSTSPDHVWIKDYAENNGLVMALREAKVIHYDVTNTHHTGFVIVNEYKLTPKALELWTE